MTESCRRSTFTKRSVGLCLLALAGLSLSGCGEVGGVPGFNPGAFTIPQKACSEVRASDLLWTLRGFEPADILNPDQPNQAQLIALVRVGQVKALRVSARSIDTSEDCNAKASGVQWIVSNTVVARLDIGTSITSGALTALQLGDTSVSAVLTFQDGTPPIQALPWAFTNVGSGTVATVRVIP